MDDQQQQTGGRERRPSIGEGVRSGIGVLVAFKEAIEETIQEAGARGDLSPDRAKEFLGGALHRAQDVAGEVRERLDLVPRREFDALRAEVEELRRRLDELQAVPRASLPPVSGGGTADPGAPGPTEARMP